MYSILDIDLDYFNQLPEPGVNLELLCRVHWLVQYPIDSPAMWLEDETWDLLRRRFTYGSHRPARWPKPDLVSVCGKVKD